MKTNERRDYFGRLAQGLTNPDAVATYERSRRESIDYFFALGRVIQRRRLGEKIDPADERIVNGDLPVLEVHMGGYVASPQFLQDMNTYASDIKAGNVRRKSITFLSDLAEAYHAETLGRPDRVITSR